MKEKMKMQVTKDEIIVAHRTGKKIDSKPQPMVVHCSQSLREHIFKFTYNLKDLVNETGDKYFVREQLPEPRASEKKEREDRMHAIKKSNSQIPEEQKHRKVPVHIKNNVLCM